MRIAFLCKRRYMGKDVILDRYARLYEMPRQLARLGHEVRCWCLSYRTELQEGAWEHEAGPGRLRWHSRRLSRLVLPDLFKYPLECLSALKKFDPDVIIAASDIPHIVWGAWLSERLGKPFVADLYDNFESFGQARIPGMVTALRWAVRQADLVLTTSEPLREYVLTHYHLKSIVRAMPSTVDVQVFHPADRLACRKRLALPADAILIGTAGALQAEKGIHTLYEAWTILQSSRPDVHLVLAGPYSSSAAPPEGARVHYLGTLPHDAVATLFCALDVGVICVPDSHFGRYSFPQKAYEMLACGLPAAVTDIGAMGEVFRDVPTSLFRPNDAADLARAVLSQIERRQLPNTPVLDWSQLIAAVEPAILSVASRTR